MVSSTIYTAITGRAAGSRASVVARARTAGSDRPLWLPGVRAPAHLDGKVLGDRGFDPLGLGTDPDRLKWYREAELMNGRFAMIGALGILATEYAVPGKWYERGAASYDLPIGPLIAIQAVVMGFLETKRYIGFKKTGECGLVNTFPWDPLGYGAQDENMKLKELKNARLAMVAMFGFFVQAVVTNDTPINNLVSHISDPFGANIVTSLTKTL